MWGENLKTEEIMDNISPLWGMCSFDKIKDGLIECRAKSRLPENPKTVIVACFPYLLGESFYGNRNVSKYAVVTDYHEVATARLKSAADELKKIFPEEEFAFFADNSPIPEQLSLFEDYEEKERRQKEEEASLEKERKMQDALVDIKHKYGKNAILKGMNFKEGATAKDRNRQIGGHKA